jgi:hypothetical protein
MKRNPLSPSAYRRLAAAVYAAAALLFLGRCSSPGSPSGAGVSERSPALSPDYSGVVLPPNIAPVNFIVREPGAGYSVEVKGEKGGGFRVPSRSGRILLPAGPWKRLLAQNAGASLTFEVSVRDSSGRWTTFKPVVNPVSADSIDGFLVYRKLGPLYTYWKTLGIFERRLDGYDETPVLLNRQTLDNCMNCHNFWKNGTDRWLLHLRGGPGTSMLLTIDGKTAKIDTKTEFNKAPAAYPAWHPSGDWIAFSVNKLLLFFHATGENREVLDRASDIIAYRVSTNTITTSPQIASPDRMENWPCWSPDGKWLYFCTSPKIESYEDSSKNGSSFAFDKIRYDLARVPFDPATGAFGPVETVLSAKQAGSSLNQPRLSPDGRFALVTLSAYSQFPVYLRDADLALVDLADGSCRRLDAVNSDRAETFHSWSSNGRWIVFSSKRLDGLLTRPFFSHVDAEGNASKPFVLPQKDPGFYDDALDNYNVPELTREPIRVGPRDLARAAFDKNIRKAQLDPAVIPARGPDSPASGPVGQPQ